MSVLLAAGRRYGVAMLCIVTTSFLGCGGSSSVPTGTVSGTFTVAGKPRTDLAVTFMGTTSGHAANAVPDDKGNFTVADPLPVGEYAIFVSPKPVEMMTEADMKPVKIDSSIPEKFWNETTTDKKLTIEEGPNTVTIDFPAS
ncbi:MAG: carboxypeptidase regulatory-like domain-containing protein [Planctomycetaceae bacterium]